jgi:pSer/pThr/pTyr-binding forkhead associated (FHA) protein
MAIFTGENMATTSGQFCPVCKFKNEPGAIICGHCGNLLEGMVEPTPTTSRLEEPNLIGGTDKNPLDLALTPLTGVGIYLENTAPVTVIEEKEFMLGRKVEGVDAVLVDLIPFGAFQMGVSRQHALMRETNDGYEIIDLNSTNGTWVDKRQLTPNTPCPVRSGALIQLGRMRLLVIYNKPTK